MEGVSGGFERLGSIVLGYWIARGERVAGGSRTRDATECRRVSVPAAHPRAVREPETGRKATGAIQSPGFRPGRRPSGRRLSDFPACRRGMCVRERTGLAQSTTKTLAFLALVGGAIV